MDIITYVLAGLLGIPAYSIMLKLTYDFIHSKIDIFKTKEE